MARYAALLRGVGPSDPRMRNEHLRQVATSLGFERVSTLLASGNLCFDSDRTDVGAIETDLEAAWPRELGFTATTLVRSADQLQALVDADPFGGLEHGRTSYLLVSFLKDPQAPPPVLPHDAAELVADLGDALCTVTDTTRTGTPDVMGVLDRHYGKRVTSRTWNTVRRVLDRLG